MTEIFLSGEKMVIQVPYCGVCNDSGQVESPVLSWRGQEYFGHGPCGCHVCAHWPQEMRAWTDRTGRTIPQAAIDAAAEGKALRHMSLVACRMCENGRRYHVWVHTKRDRNTSPEEWSFDPERLTFKGLPPMAPDDPQRYRKVDERSEEGREIVALWREQRSGAKRLTAADVTRAARRLFAGRSVPTAEGEAAAKRALRPTCRHELLPTAKGG